MAQPRPREEFESDGDYLKAFWIMSEFGVDAEAYEVLIPSSTGILLLNVHRLHKKKALGRPACCCHYFSRLQRQQPKTMGRF